LRQIPNKRAWKKGLAELFDDQKANRIISRAQSIYLEYCGSCAREAGRANRNALMARILPALSLYHVLLAEGMDQEEALSHLDCLFRRVFFTKRMQGIRVLNHLPNPFTIVRPLMKWMIKDDYLPGSQEIVEDNVDCLAVKVYHCFIFDALTTYGAKELTPLFCNTDDWLAAELPSINWERTKTLGRGGDYCDFRWSRKI